MLCMVCMCTHLKTCQSLMYSEIRKICYTHHSNTFALKLDSMKQGKASYLHIMDNPIDEELGRSCNDQVLLLTRYEVTVNRKLHSSGGVSLSVHSIHP